MTKILFLAVWYCSIFPGALWLCAFTLLVNFYSDRFALMVRNVICTIIMDAVLKYRSLCSFRQPAAILEATTSARNKNLEV